MFEWGCFAPVTRFHIWTVQKSNMQTTTTPGIATTSSGMNDLYGLESFLQGTRRRFLFLNTMAALATAVSVIMVWSFLLLLWTVMPQEPASWFRVAYLLPTLLLGYGLKQLRSLHTNTWKQWSENKATVLGSLGLGLALVAILSLPSPAGGTLYAYWWVGTGSSLLYLLWSFVRISQLVQQTSIADQVEEWNPTAKGYLTALELSRSMEKTNEHQGFSDDLAEARIDQVRQSMRNLSPVQVVPGQRFEERALLLLVMGFMFFGCLLTAPGWMTQKFGMLMLPPPPVVKGIGRTEQKIVVADLVITYRYPAYTGRMPRTIHNSDGSLFALKGTQVVIRARALEPISRATMVINQKKLVPLTIGKDKQAIEGSINLLKPGNYQFRFATVQGNLQRGSIRNIRIQPDHNPKVELRYPKKDLEVKEREEVPIVYRASDDFGVSKVYLVYKNLSSRRFNKPKKILLKDFKSPPTKSMQQASWELVALPFGPGDKIAYHIEVHDNDSISGPKKGRSRTRHINIFSPLKAHEKLLLVQEKLLKQMVNFLADLLTAPKPLISEEDEIYRNFRTLDAKASELIGFFKRLLPQMRKDSLTKPYTLVAIENLLFRFSSRHNQRQFITKRMRLSLQNQQQAPAYMSSAKFPRELAASQITGEIPYQEDDVYALTMLLNRQRLDILKDLAKQLTNSQNRVQDLLEQYRKKRDKATKQALMQELARLERLIRDINRRMQKLHRQIPDEHLNMQAFKNKSTMGKLKRLKDMVKKDNLEEAAKELSKLAQNIEKMVSQMDRYSKQAGGQGLQRMVAAMKKIMQQIQQLEKKQERLSNRTRDVQRQVAKRMNKDLKKKLKKILKKQLERTKKMRQEMKDIRNKMGRDMQRYRLSPRQEKLERRIQELEKMLKMGDVHESMEVIQQYQNQVQWHKYSMQRMKRMFQRHRRHRAQAAQKSKTSLQKTESIARKIQQDLRKIFPSPKPYMKAQDKRRMQRYSQQQEMLRQEARKLERRMARMAKRMPMFKSTMQKGLKEAAGEMNGAKHQLKRNSAQPAFGHQQKAISKLRKVRRQMSRSMKRQGKKGGKQGKGKRGGRGRYRTHQEVKIPDPSKHKAPKALRQDILDAMKEKFPHKYKEQIHRYYEKLAK